MLGQLAFFLISAMFRILLFPCINLLVSYLFFTLIYFSLIFTLAFNDGHSRTWQLWYSHYVMNLERVIHFHNFLMHFPTHAWVDVVVYENCRVEILRPVLMMDWFTRLMLARIFLSFLQMLLFLTLSQTLLCRRLMLLWPLLLQLCILRGIVLWFATLGVLCVVVPFDDFVFVLLFSDLF